MKVVKFALMGMFAASLFSGCAVTKAYVDLGYTSAEAATAVDGAKNISLSVNMNDAREVKDKISCKKNGYGMEMAAIMSKQDVPGLVKSAIVEELQKRGFNVSDVKQGLQIDLTKVYNDFKIGMWSGSAVADVTFMVQVKKSDGSIILVKNYAGKNAQKGLQLCSPKHAQNAINAALTDVVKNLFEDKEFIAALLKTN